MEASKRVIRTERVEYFLKTPAHHTEVEKAVAVAARDLESRGARHRTDIWIHGDGDEIIVRFEVDEQVRGS